MGEKPIRQCPAEHVCRSLKTSPHNQTPSSQRPGPCQGSAQIGRSRERGSPGGLPRRDGDDGQSAWCAQRPRSTTQNGNTHERPHALPEHIHWDAGHPACRLNPTDDEERALDPGGEDEAVGEERGAVGYDVREGLGEGDDVRGVCAVGVDQVCGPC